jgi:hypothetical protein
LPLTYVIATLFTSFLIVDLVIGTVFYPKRIDLLSGWTHHIVYIYILLDFLLSSVPGLLGPFCLLEFPTFLLALGNLNSKWRRDFYFGILFFLTRIVYHGWFIFRYYQMLFGHRFFFYVALSFPLHCFWFYKFTLGIIKKNK